MADAKSASSTAVTRNDRRHIVYFVEFKTAANCSDACAVLANDLQVLFQFDRFVTLMIPFADEKKFRETINKVVRSPGIFLIDRARTIVPPSPPEPPSVRGRDDIKIEKVIRGGLGSSTGKGVVIAIVDSGVDFRHPDFVRNVSGKKESRFLAVWDTTRDFKEGVGKPGPKKYFEGVPVGTIFTREDLTADLANNSLGSFDNNGHGTACAGIAAGNGKALADAKGKAAGDKDLQLMDYRGVAPDADLVAVRVSHEAGSSMPNVWLLNAACEWIDGLAKDKPVVISCSYGGQDGGHDGTKVDERWLSHWIDTRPVGGPSRMVFIAAGNEAQDSIHASTSEFSTDQLAELTWDIKKGDAEIKLWVEPVDKEGNRVSADDIEVKFVGEKTGEEAFRRVHPVSGSVQINLDVFRTGGLRLSSKTKRKFTADAYIYSVPLPDGDNGVFTSQVQNLKQIGTPASAISAFAVGSYDFNPTFLPPGGLRYWEHVKTGQLSAYSNAGFLRTGQVKPDLAAPGQFFTSPVPQPVPLHLANRKQTIDVTGMYRRFNGTSAATPYAAGVAALVLEKKPTLSSKEYRELLKRCGTQDGFTGPLPDKKWGYGKLDVAAVEKMLKAVQ
jgi:subtilisin family serine protease